MVLPRKIRWQSDTAFSQSNLWLTHKITILFKLLIYYGLKRALQLNCHKFVSPNKPLRQILVIIIFSSYPLFSQIHLFSVVLLIFTVSGHLSYKLCTVFSFVWWGLKLHFNTYNSPVCWFQSSTLFMTKGLAQGDHGKKAENSISMSLVTYF